MLQKLWQWIVRTVLLQALDALGKYIPHVLEQWKKEKQRELLQKEAHEEYLKVIQDQGTTKEDRMKAYEKFINSGSK